MGFLKVGKDGGADSTVTGYWLFEFKWLFSIVLLKFEKGTREAFHSHAFNAVTWFLSGRVVEELLDGTRKVWVPSFWPKYTPRDNFHKVTSLETTWALSFRGPWSKTWQEYRPKDQEFVTLSSGRAIESRRKGDRYE